MFTLVPAICSECIISNDIFAANHSGHNHYNQSAVEITSESIVEITGTNSCSQQQ